MRLTEVVLENPPSILRKRWPKKPFVKMVFGAYKESSLFIPRALVLPSSNQTAHINDGPSKTVQPCRLKA